MPRQQVNREAQSVLGHKPQSVEHAQHVLAGQVAVVTGASGGIGGAIAVALARCGVRLCLIGRGAEKLGKLRGQIEASKSNATEFALDLTHPQSAKRLNEAIRREFGGLNILVHCAGVISLSRMEQARIEDFERQLAINVVAPYRLTRDLLPLLRESKGQIAFINSSIIHNPRAGTTQFAATQHALKGLADCLRQEVNELGIRVLSIYAGRTATMRVEGIFKTEGKRCQPERLLQPEDVADTLVHAMSLPGTAEVTDVYIRPMLKH